MRCWQIPGLIAFLVLFSACSEEVGNELRDRAEAGDSAAQYALGLMYEEGRVEPQDYGEAARWYRMAAEQGDVGSQVALGSLYEQGLGVTRNAAEAAKWYKMAGEQGHAGAQVTLAVMHAEESTQKISIRKCGLNPHRPRRGRSRLRTQTGSLNKIMTNMSMILLRARVLGGSTTSLVGERFQRRSQSRCGRYAGSAEALFAGAVDDERGR